jgi:mRNA interferase RelE/StbE
LSYRIEFASSANKELAKLIKKIQPKQARLITETIEDLQEDPWPPGVETVEGEENLWRVRQGDYRIIYSIEENVLVVYIVKVGHRKDVYKKR